VKGWLPKVSMMKGFMGGLIRRELKKFWLQVVFGFKGNPGEFDHICP
jgi:hypothetical protein